MSKWLKTALISVMLLVVAAAVMRIVLYTYRPLTTSCFIRHGDNPRKALDRAVGRCNATLLTVADAEIVRSRHEVTKTFRYQIALADTSTDEFLDVFQKELLFDLALTAGDVNAYSGFGHSFQYRYRRHRRTIGEANARVVSVSDGSLELMVRLSEIQK